MLRDFIEDQQNVSYGFYQCKDPDQITIKVTVQCKSLGDVQEESVVIGWQQKLFSTSELDLYSKYTEQGGELQCKFQDQIASMLASGKTCGHISTHVHGEEHMSSSQIFREVSSRQPPLSRLARGYSGSRFHNGKEAGLVRPEDAPVVDTLQSAIRSLSLTDTKFFSAVVNVSDVEMEICRIQWDSSGNLSVYPDFSYNPASYRIYAGDGSHVIGEYWLQLCASDSDKLVSSHSHSPDFPHLAKTITNATVSRNSREKSVSSSSALFAFPAPGECFVMYYGQIVSARGFENNEILLQYTVDLPTGWRSSDTTVLSAVTQWSSADPVANFSFPIHAELAYDVSATDAHTSVNLSKIPQLCIVVMAKRRSGVVSIEGYCNLSLPSLPGVYSYDLMAWRPVTGLRAEIARFFVGTSVPSLDSVSLTVPQRHQRNKLSMFPTTVVGVGSVKLEINCLKQYDTSLDVGVAETYSYALSESNMPPVLRAFARARTKLLQAKQFQTDN